MISRFRSPLLSTIRSVGGLHLATPIQRSLSHRSFVCDNHSSSSSAASSPLSSSASTPTTSSPSSSSLPFTPSSSFSSSSLSSSSPSPSSLSSPDCVTDLHRLIVKFRIWGNDPHLFGRIIDKFVYTIKQNHGFISRPPQYKRVKVERYAMKKSPFKYEYARRILIRKSYSCEIEVPIPPKYYLIQKGWDLNNPLMNIESFGECIGVAEKGMTITYKWTDSFIDRMSNIVSQTDADLQASYIHDVVPNNFEALYPSHLFPVDVHLAQEKWKAEQIEKENQRSIEERLQEWNNEEARRGDKLLIMKDDCVENGKPRLASPQERSWREIKDAYNKYLVEKNK